MNSAEAASRVASLEESAACPHCGSTSRVGRGLCLKCLLQRGLGEETLDEDSLENALNQVNLPDAEWRIGNYQILDEIGRGGMGVIYRARQRHSRRIVALKRILTHHSDSRDTLVRFRREAEAAASLDHPNILPIYEVSEGEDGLPFFSMKFAAGGSLAQNEFQLRRQTRRIVDVMAKVCRAVEYAHNRGILHRDLKPGNILLDGRGEPLVSDFGLAKWLDASSDLTRTLTIFGTPGYIAPEQARGPATALKPTADIYSLGAILFDLLAGRPPFLGEHALSVIDQAKDKAAPKLRSIIPGTDRDLETICAHCLEREPDARYSSAAGVAEDLERWLEGRPVVARPVAPPVRIWRWAKRNPKLATSVAGSLLGGLAIAIFATLVLGPTGSRLRMLPNVSEKSVAVLPFQNLSEEKQDAFFASGVQDEILNDLSKVADLKVISRTSSMQYKGGSNRNVREISRELRVAHIVEGSVQRIGNRIRVSAQLVDARNDEQIWAERYDRDVADIFAIESELSEKIAARLKATLSPREKAAIEEPLTNDLDAYDLYTRAKGLIDGIAFTATGRDDLLQAIHLLDRAVNRDPTFFLGYYQLARANDTLYLLGFDHTPSRLAAADQAIQTVIRLRPNSGEAHLGLAQHLYSGYRDYDRSRQELIAASSVLPNESFLFVLQAQIDRRQNRWEESVKDLQRALDLDPRNTSMLRLLSISYEYLRQFDKMATILDRILTIVPNDNTTRAQRAYVDLIWHGYTTQLHDTLKSILAADSSAASSLSGHSMYLAVCERDPVAARNALKALPADGCRDAGLSFPRAWCEATVANLEDNKSLAENALLRAREEVESVVRVQPDYAEGYCMLGVIDAALGQKLEAIREGKRSVELLPVSKDSLNGTKLLEYLAVIYATTGEQKLALEELAKVAGMPSDLTYGGLRLHPQWDPLRGDRRFEKITASLAPDRNKYQNP